MTNNECGHTVGPTKELESDVIAQITGLKKTGHIIVKICNFTGAGRKNVKKYVQRFKDGRKSTQYV